MANKNHLAKLKEGVEAWNKWRKSNPDENPDLVGANLKGKNLVGANFSKANLQGASLNGVDLAGADFSHARLQSVKFTAANLSDANFNHAIAGLQNFWAVSLVIFSLFLSLLSGLFASIAGTSLAFLFFPVIVLVYGITPNVLVLVAFGVFAITTIFRGSGVGIAAGVIASGLALIIQLLVGFLGAKQGIMALATSGMATLFLGIVATVAIAVAVTAAGIAAVPSIITGVLAVAGIVSGILTVGTSEVRVQAETGELVGLIATGGTEAAWSLAITGVGVIIAWRALVEDEKQNFIRQIAIFIATIKGTSFRRANLTDANFMEAQLKNTDLREAIITRTVWHSAKMLDLARTGFSYLQHPKIRDLVVNRKGQNKNFDRLDLRGINLSGAELQNASFIGTDLNRANLFKADLSRAKLVQTLLEGANLTEAILTGAIIQDWGTSSTTQLLEIKCDYIFLKFPTEENFDSQRRPTDSSRNFDPGEFEKLAVKSANTVDLVFQDGIDWQVFLETFQKLRVESDTGELPVVQTIENKSDRAFVIRVKVPKDVDEGEYERKFWQKYKPLLDEKDKKIKDLSEDIKERRKANTMLMGVIKKMAEKDKSLNDKQIDILKVIHEGKSTDKEIIECLNLNHDLVKYYLEEMKNQKYLIASKYLNNGISYKGITLTNKGRVAMNNPEDLVKNENDSRTINTETYNEQSGNFGVGVNKGKITTETLAGVINQLPSSSDPDKPGIKELLEQLEQAIAKSEELNDEEKDEALEEVKTLAEAGKNPDEQGNKKQAKRGITMLRGIAAGLPPTAALLTICKELLPAIASFFGL